MVRGEILITLKDGSIVSYANKFLAAKDTTLTDEAGTQKVLDRFGQPILDEKGEEVTVDISTPLFKGYDEVSYYYTGAGNDTFEDQTGLGKIKGDYEYLTQQLGVVGNDVLRFPEASEEHDDTKELVRKVTSTVNGVPTFSRKQIATEAVASISIKETWVNYPFGRESGYQLSKASNNFMGFNESEMIKLKGLRGPDFNKNLKFDNGFIPNPILKIENDKLVVVNAEIYDDVVTTETDKGYEVFGKKGKATSGVTFIRKE